MRVIKVLSCWLSFSSACSFSVQNTAILETPLVLQLGAFGLHAETPVFLSMSCCFWPSSWAECSAPCTSWPNASASLPIPAA